MPDEHLTTEELSALLDRGPQEAGGSAHLENCAVCRREMELLRRMRMALSALDDREAPAGAWTSIESELDQRGTVEAAVPASPGEGRAGRSFSTLVHHGWLRAAAAVLLFAGGLGLGTLLSSPAAVDGGDSGSVASDRAAAGDDRPVGTSGDEDELSYREAMERLEALRSRGPSFREAYRNPEAAAEHLARLDALMRASREALREDPADPALNDFLFQVAEEREALNRALRLSSLEYR